LIFPLEQTLEFCHKAAALTDKVAVTAKGVVGTIGNPAIR
jgi:hypothetical protein